MFLELFFNSPSLLPIYFMFHFCLSLYPAPASSPQTCHTTTWSVFILQCKHNETVFPYKCFSFLLLSTPSLHEYQPTISSFSTQLSCSPPLSLRAIGLCNNHGSIQIHSIHFIKLIIKWSAKDGLKYHMCGYECVGGITKCKLQSVGVGDGARFSTKSDFSC